MMMLTISLTTTSYSTTHAAVRSQQQASILIDWYFEGYNDGYNDAIAHRTYFYSGLRRPIPEWEMETYTAGYNQGWSDGGGTH